VYTNVHGAAAGVRYGKRPGRNLIDIFSPATGAASCTAFDYPCYRPYLLAVDREGHHTRNIQRNI
jgi:hypothetical protein